MSIYLGAAPLYKVAVEACQSIPGEPERQPGRSMALVSIVFAAASIEAYFDALTAFALRNLADGASCPSEVEIFAKMSELVGSSRGSVRLRYQLAIWMFTNRPCATGGEPYQDLKLLFDTRNDLVHMKQKDMDQEVPAAVEGRTTIRNSRTIERLRSLNIAADSSGSWHYRISTKAAARWACTVNRNVITTINQAIPNSALRDDFTAMYQNAFREEL